MCITQAQHMCIIIVLYHAHIHIYLFIYYKERRHIGDY